MIVMMIRILNMAMFNNDDTNDGNDVYMMMIMMLMMTVILIVMADSDHDHDETYSFVHRML